jgi:hypothetical protein
MELEGPRPWRIDLIVQYYKMCLRTNSPGLLAAAQILAGPVARPLHLDREGVIAGHWRKFIMEQYKIFPDLWTSTEPCSAAKKLRVSDRWAQSIQWDQLLGLTQWSKVIHFRSIFTWGQGKARNFYLTPSMETVYPPQLPVTNVSAQTTGLSFC